MAYYVYELELEPVPGGPHFNDYQSAIASIWIESDDVTDARVRVARLVGRAGWNVKAARAERVLPLSQHPRNRKDKQLDHATPAGLEIAYQELLRKGECGEFFAQPRKS